MNQPYSGTVSALLKNAFTVLIFEAGPKATQIDPKLKPHYAHVSPIQVQHGATWRRLVAVSHQVGPEVHTTWGTRLNTQLCWCQQNVANTCENTLPELKQNQTNNNCQMTEREEIPLCHIKSMHRNSKQISSSSTLNNRRLDSCAATLTKNKM